MLNIQEMMNEMSPAPEIICNLGWFPENFPEKPKPELAYRKGNNITNTYKNWNFSTADFSCVAGGNRFGNGNGNVLFVRNPAQVKKWHEAVKDIDDEDNYPKLYVYGVGRTLDEAFKDAYDQIDKIDDL